MPLPDAFRAHELTNQGLCGRVDNTGRRSTPARCNLDPAPCWLRGSQSRAHAWPTYRGTTAALRSTIRTTTGARENIRPCHVRLLRSGRRRRCLSRHRSREPRGGHLNPLDGSYLNEFRKDEGVDTSYTKYRENIDKNPFNRVQPSDGLLYVGWTEPGEWFNLTVDVAEAGTYLLNVLYTSNRGAKIALDLNFQPLVPDIQLASTFDPQRRFSGATGIIGISPSQWRLCSRLAETSLPFTLWRRAISISPISNFGRTDKGIALVKMAEREGFQPSVPFRVHVISNHAHSATLPPLRVPDDKPVRWAKGMSKGHGKGWGQTQSPALPSAVG